MLVTSKFYSRCSSRSVFGPAAILAPRRRRLTTTFTEPIEEETLPRYHPENYYPVSIGQVFHERYKVLANLGFGGSSTTWLAQDVTRWRFQKNRFVTLKILTRDVTDDHSTSSELALSTQIAQANLTHEGLRYVRTILDSFEAQSRFGVHLCLAYTPMRETLSTFARRLQNGCLPSNLVKPLLKFLLTGLDYLHTQCQIIHTDLKPDNILLGIEDDEIINELIKEEQRHPSPAKVYDNRRVYAHRNFGDLRGPPGRPKIADFGLAVRSCNGTFNHPIQPDLLQAPEVILRAGWSYSADIWNLGVMIWDLLEGQSLFEAFDSDTDTYAPEIHLNEMIAFLGPPPEQLLVRGKSTAQFFTPEGTLINTKADKPRGTGLECTITTLSGEDKKMFLRFVGRMLRWLPEDRATAQELLKDPWLCS